MSQEQQVVGNQAANRERAIADLRRSATQVALLALDACPGEATMMFCLRFGNHLSTLAHLARGQQQLRGEQPGNQPPTNKPQPRKSSKNKPPNQRPQAAAPNCHEGIATNGRRARSLAEELALL